MLNDPQRLASLLLDPERPVQIVIAGKAHPADEAASGLSSRWSGSGLEAVRRRIVFLPDYDMALARFSSRARRWVNNPLRPLEACGTSGMKVALNGGLNLSVRDGWWDESGTTAATAGRSSGKRNPDRPQGRAGGVRAVRADRQSGSAPLFYDASMEQRPARAGWGWSGTGCLAGPPRTASPGGPHGRRLRDRAVRSGRARLAGAGVGRQFAGGARSVEGQRPPGMAGVRIEHVEADGAEPSAAPCSTSG